MTDEIMYALMELSGQTYVDLYAASVKEKAAAAQARSDGAAPSAVEPSIPTDGEDDEGHGTSRVPGTRAS
jgi:1-acyl-sn-glycerol-3-phosphate acyltransferase